MKIQQVEELVGISKKNIRFYEAEGLLSPGRAENGYREYGLGDVDRLKRIKLMRKLSVPLEDIRGLLQEGAPLDLCLARRLQQIERQQESLSALKGMGERLLRETPGQTLNELDVDGCLEELERLEREGATFMDLDAHDVHRRKTAGAIVGAVFIVALILPVLFVILWVNRQVPLPTWLLALFVASPIVFTACVAAVLIQRIKEIKGGEEDEAAQY